MTEFECAPVKTGRFVIDWTQVVVIVRYSVQITYLVDLQRADEQVQVGEVLFDREPRETVLLSPSIVVQFNIERLVKRVELVVKHVEVLVGELARAVLSAKEARTVFDSQKT